MDNIATTAMEQRGFWELLSGLLGKLTSMEVFILAAMGILAFLAYKSGDKIKKIFTEREETAVKRTNDINNLSNSILDVRNELRSYKGEHSIEHKHLDKDITVIKESVKEMQRDMKGFGVSISKIHSKLDRFLAMEAKNA